MSSSTMRARLGGIRDRLQRVLPKAIPEEDELFLSPFEKFEHYRVIPVKLILNLSMMVMLYVFVFTYHIDRYVVDTNSRFALANALYGAPDNTDNSLNMQFFNLSDMQNAISNLVVAYHQLPDESPGTFSLYCRKDANLTDDDEECPVEPVRMTVRVMTHRATPRWQRFGPAIGDDDSITTLTFELNESNPLGPLANVGNSTGYSLDSLMQYDESCQPITTRFESQPVIPCRNGTIAVVIDRIVDITLSLRIRGVRVYSDFAKVVGVQWSPSFVFSFVYNEAVINMAATFGFSATVQFSVVAVTCATVLVPLALWDMGLRCRSLQWYYFHHSYINARAAQRPDLLRRMRRAGGPGWRFFGIFSDAMVLLMCLFYFVNSFSFTEAPGVRVWNIVVLAIACACETVLLVSHINASPRFYVVIQTLFLLIPKLLLYSIGVIPIFLGYALCGFASFGALTNVYDTFYNSMITLFCIVNGDSLLQLFTEIQQTDFWPMRLFSRMFQASFLFFMFCVVLNILLAIVVDTYEDVKEMFKIMQFDDGTKSKAIEKQLTKEKSGTFSPSSPVTISSIPFEVSIEPPPSAAPSEPVTLRDLVRMRDQLDSLLQ